jgi:hypothetical protein
MIVGPQHDRQAFTATVVPEAARIGVAAVGGPVPIALNDFGDRMAATCWVVSWQKLKSTVFTLGAWREIV